MSLRERFNIFPLPGMSYCYVTVTANGCLRICNSADSRQEPRRLTRAPCGNWPNIIVALRTNSAMKSCASTFSISPMKEKWRGRRPPSRSCGIKFFYEQTLKHEWPTLRFVRPLPEHKPVVLSRDEVRRILALVKIPVYRACLTTIYACGLRLLEGIRLQVPDVDSTRMLLHIHGKNKQGRYVPLPATTLQLPRVHWRTHRSPLWLFPAPKRHGLAHSRFVPMLIYSLDQKPENGRDRCAMSFEA
jgi:integrase